MTTHGHDIEQLRTIQKCVKLSEIIPKRGQIWKHYKGGKYQVLEVVMNEKDESISVIYNGICKENIMPIPWSRSLDDWNATVEAFQPDGSVGNVQRFTLHLG